MKTAKVDPERFRTVHQRLCHALERHRHPNSPIIDQARNRLRETLRREPQHRNDETMLRYRERALARFDRAVRRAERCPRVAPPEVQQDEDA